MQRVAVVVIGRNEGQRLVRCLHSVVADDRTVVYVDSGSSDGSVALAQGLGVEVVQLDMNRPFTAARARNAGFQRLAEVAPDAQFVQFVDGDCEVISPWLEAAAGALKANPQVAVVAGRLRERHAHRSIYNRLCDLEWRILLAKSHCGGNAMMRRAAFGDVGGFDETIIAGEEPELCMRLRLKQWKVLCISHDMAWHDAHMLRFSQWWRRAVRAGHAFAEGAAKHGRQPERHGVRQSCSIWFWGFIVPLAALAFAWPTWGWSLLLLVLYAVLMMRLMRYCLRQEMTFYNSVLFTTFTVLGKFPQLFGQVKYWGGRLRGKRSALIEYKGPAQEAA